MIVINHINFNHESAVDAVQFAIQPFITAILKSDLGGRLDGLGILNASILH